MRTYERFLRYAKIHTASDETSQDHPSSQRQLDLARLLVQELQELGLADAAVNQYGIVTATLPATGGLQHLPAIGFLAHMDTVPDFSGENVKPLLWENYDGGDISLPENGVVIRAQDFPFLKQLKGKTVITASGDSVLGADDKAGIAEIMTMCQRLTDENLPHG